MMTEFQYDLFASKLAESRAPAAGRTRATPFQQAEVLRYAAHLGYGLYWTRGHWAVRRDGNRYVECELMDDGAELWCPLMSVWVAAWRMGYDDETVLALESAIVEAVRFRYPKTSEIFDQAEDSTDALARWIDSFGMGWTQAVAGVLEDAAEVIEHGRPTPKQFRARMAKAKRSHARWKWTAAGTSIQAWLPAQEWILNCAEIGGHGW